jgi:hypothetical protein
MGRAVTTHRTGGVRGSEGKPGEVGRLVDPECGIDPSYPIDKKHVLDRFCVRKHGPPVLGT